MTLQKKTLIVLAATVLGLVLLLYGGARFLILPSFDELESEYVRTVSQQVMAGFISFAERVDGYLRQYSAWDDTVAFMRGQNAGFPESNFVPDTFESMGVNLVVCLDGQGLPVYREAYDLEARRRMPFPEGLEPHLQTGSLLVTHRTPDSVVRGVLMLPEGPLLVASRPIVGTNMTGPIMGTLLMGRFHDEDLEERGKMIVQQGYTVERLDATVFSSLLQSWPPKLREGQNTFSVPVDDRVIRGYGMVLDIYGEPAVLVRTDLPRDVYRKRLLTERTLIWSILVAGGAFGLVMLLGLRFLILSRVSRLERNVRQIAGSGDASRRVQVLGNDELAGLASSLNRMLEALEASREALLESEETARALMNATLDSAFLVDDRGTVLAANEPAARRLGMNTEELLGASFYDVLPREVAEMRLARIREVVSTGRRVRFEDSREGLTFVLSMYPVLGSSGRVERVAIFARDITERRRAEEALRASEQKYRELVESANSIVLRLDLEGRITFLNRFGLEFFGYEEHEILGHAIFDTILPETDSSGTPTHRMFADLLQRPERYAINENENVRRNGERVWVAWTNRPILDDSGQVAEILSIGTDISKRKRAEESLMHRAEMERIVSGISSRFLNASARDLAACVNEALEAVGKFVEADRSYVYLRRADEEVIELVYEWCAPDVAPLDYARQGVGAGDFPWFYAAMSEQGIVHIPNVDALPPEARRERRFLAANDVKSLLDVPLMSHGEFLGTWGFSTLGEYRTWAKEDISLLKVMGEILVNAFQRARAEEALVLQNARLEALLELGQMAGQSRDRVTTFVLEKGIHLTKSAFGLIAAVNRNGAELQPLCWSENVMDQCRLGAQPIHVPEDSESVWARAVRDRVPVIINGPSAFPGGGRCPAGHVALERFLAVPILDEQRVVAVAGVANKASNYDLMDANQLTLLMNGAWNHMRRYEAAAWIRREIEEIASIQKGLLPSTMPRIKGVELVARYATFERAGGDYYDVFPIPPVTTSKIEEHRRWALLIADASGHGPSAAVVVTMLSTLLHSFSHTPSRPGDLLEYVNPFLFAKSVHGSFITALLAFIDLDTMKVAYAAAGHNLPLLRFLDGTVQTLPSTGGFPLGIQPASQYDDRSFSIEHGQTLLLYTDGITESMSPLGELYGEERLGHALRDGEGSAPEILDTLMRRLRAHEHGMRPTDDQTMVLAQFR